MEEVKVIDLLWLTGDQLLLGGEGVHHGPLDKTFGSVNFVQQVASIRMLCNPPPREWKEKLMKEIYEGGRTKIPLTSDFLGAVQTSGYRVIDFSNLDEHTNENNIGKTFGLF